MLVLQRLPENYLQNASETSRRQAAFLEGPPLYKQTAKRIQEKFLENSAKIFLLKMPQILGQKGQSFDPHNHMPPEFDQREAELNNFNGMSQSPLCKHSPKAKRSRLVKVVVLSSFRKTSVWISPARDSYGFDQIRSSKMLKVKVSTSDLRPQMLSSVSSLEIETLIQHFVAAV